MQKDFHYYATYAAANIAGYSHEEALDIAYSAQFVDLCSPTFLKMIKGPAYAATTQLQLELADARSDLIGIQQMTQIWASFHFLPFDLYADVKGSKRYRNKYHLICDTNGDLLLKTVELAKGGSLQSIGIAMHVLADTWAHRYFAGTPSMVINNTNYYFFELLQAEGETSQRKITFRHSTSAEDDIENGVYINSVPQPDENAIMYLGHGRAGHLPDYSFIRYKYLPAWGDYEEIIKDNSSDYLHAFGQMIHALKYLHGDIDAFEKEQYEMETIAPWKEEIVQILEKRQLDASNDWKAFGERLSGREIDEFDFERYHDAYRSASGEDKDETFLGRFFLGALAQKYMVTDQIFQSNNRLAGTVRKKKEREDKR